MAYYCLCTAEPPRLPGRLCVRAIQISCELGDPYEVAEQTPIVWYLALRAADVFKTRNGRYPGEEDDQVGGEAAGNEGGDLMSMGDIPPSRARPYLCTKGFRLREWGLWRRRR